jgi:hypothetical protein
MAPTRRLDDTPAEDSRCIQHTIALQSHESRLGHAEERINVHDRTLFGFNGREQGLVGRFEAMSEMEREGKKNRFLILLTLLACVLEGGIAISIAVLR